MIDLHYANPKLVFNRAGASSWNNYNEIKKVLYKHRSVKSKDTVVLAATNNGPWIGDYKFYIKKDQKHTFYEYAELRETVLHAIGSNLNNNPNSTTISIYVPKWYTIWYRLIVKELHEKGFRVKINSSGVALCNEGSTIWTNDDKEAMILKGRSDTPIDIYLKTNYEFGVKLREHFDMISVLPIVPYTKKRPKDETVCAIGIYDNSKMLTYSGVYRFDAYLLMADEGKYLHAFTKRHYDTGIIGINLNRYYNDKTITNEFREFVNSVELLVNKRYLIDSPDYGNISVYCDKKVVGINQIIAATYSCYKDALRVKEGMASIYKDKKVSTKEAVEETINNVFLQ